MYVRLYTEASIPKMVAYVYSTIVLVLYFSYLGANNKLWWRHTQIQMISFGGGGGFTGRMVDKLVKRIVVMKLF